LTYNNHDFIFLGSCFVGRLKRIDSSCELLDFFALCVNATCVIKGDQYAKSPCNHFKVTCIDLDDIFSDEEAISTNVEAKNLRIDFSRISRDPSDIKTFLWAYKTDKTAVWTCDKELLKLCFKHDIPRCCFKAAIKIVDDCMDESISNDVQYKTEDMKSGDDPFYHYDNNKRCETHCGLKDSCICFKCKTVS